MRERSTVSRRGEVSAGGVLATAARTVTSDLPAFVWLAGLGSAPAQLLSIVYGELLLGKVMSAFAVVGRDGVEMGQAALAVASWLVPSIGAAIQWAVTTYASGALVYGTLVLLAGRRPVASAMLGHSYRLFPNVLLVGLCTVVSAAFGVLAGVVPGLALACVLYLAVPAAAVEHHGAFAALKRSAQLTQGFRGTVFALTLLGFAMVLAPAALRAIALVAASARFETMSGLEGADPSFGFRLVTYSVSWFLDSLALLVSVVVPTVLYVRVRAVRDSVCAETLCKAMSQREIRPMGR